MNKPLFALLLSLGSALPAQADFSDSLVPTIMNGNPVGDMEPAVRHAVMIRTATGICSGTIIGPDLVLTAAHCFQGRPDPEELSVSFGVKGRSASRGVRAYLPHSGFSVDIGNDVALVQLDGVVPAGFAPAPFFSGRLKPGASVQVAGYGRTNANGEGVGTLRRTTLRFEQYQEKNEAVLKGPGGLGTCLGDSGGPSFVERNGRLELFGVVSRGPTADCKGFELHGVASAHLAWIDRAVKAIKREERRPRKERNDFPGDPEGVEFY